MGEFKIRLDDNLPVIVFANERFVLNNKTKIIKITDTVDNFLQFIFLPPLLIKFRIFTKQLIY